MCKRITCAFWNTLGSGASILTAAIAAGQSDAVRVAKERKCELGSHPKCPNNACMGDTMFAPAGGVALISHHSAGVLHEMMAAIWSSVGFDAILKPPESSFVVLESKPQLGLIVTILAQA